MSGSQSSISEKSKKPVTVEVTGFLMVGVARLELAASWSRKFVGVIGGKRRKALRIKGFRRFSLVFRARKWAKNAGEIRRKPRI